MKITGVDLTPVASRRETGSVARHVIVRLQTDEGLIGLGEMSDVGDWGIMYDLNDVKGAYESLLVGKDPLDWRPITTAARGRLRMGARFARGSSSLFSILWARSRINRLLGCSEDR